MRSPLWRPSIYFQAGFFSVLIFALIGCSSNDSLQPPLVEEGTIDLRDWNFETSGKVPLDGAWEFFHNVWLPHLRNPTPTPASVFLPVPLNWASENNQTSGYPLHGIGTYRIKLKLPTFKRLALKVDAVGMAHELWINNQLYKKIGRLGKSAEEEIPRLEKYVVALPATEDIEIVIPVSNFSNLESGLLGSFFIGLEDDLLLQRKLALTFSTFMIGSFLIMGMYHGFLYFRRRGDKLPLYFSCFCFATVGSFVVDGEFSWNVYLYFMDWDWVYRISYFSLSVITPSFYLFHTQLYPEDIPRKGFKTIMVSSIVYGVSVLTTPHTVHRTILLLYIFIMLGILLYTFIGMIRALMNKRKGINYIFLGTVILTGTATRDLILELQGTYEHVYWFPVGMLFFLFPHSLMMADQYAGAYRRIEQQNETLKQNEHDLLIQNQELIRLEKVKDDFLATASHELRTPIHGLIGVSHSLIHSSLHPEVEDHHRASLEMIMNSGQRIAALVQNIQDFSRLKYEDLTLSYEAINLIKLVDYQIQFLKYSYAHKPIQVENRIFSNFPVIYADRERMEQILLNLLENAFKYTSEGHITVSAAFLEDSHQVLIQIQDTGIGLSEEEQKLVFAPFERTATAKQFADGMGLGLALVQKLIHLHEGQLSVTSEPNKGSCFTIQFPNQPHLVKSVPSFLDEPQRSDFSPKSPSTQTSLEIPLVHNNALDSNLPHILAVEDDPVNMQVLMNYLGSKGFNITTAINGLEALEVIEGDSSFDLVLFDVMMPQMNGLEACKRIRQQFSRNELPILLLTAKTQPKDIALGFQAGANDYLTKPFVQEELLARVQAQIESKQNYLALKEQLHPPSPRSQSSVLMSDFSHLAETSPETRKDLVKLLQLSVSYWQEMSQMNKVDLAEKSGFWKVFLEKRGVFRARTLERHLAEKSLPKRPHWKQIIQTAEFVLSQYPDVPSRYQSLVQQLKKIKA